MSKTRCIFMASDPIAIPSLECILGDFSESIELTHVYTQPDRRTGRGKKLTQNAIKTWAFENNIPVLQPNKIDADAIEEFTKFGTDLVIVMAYGHILPTPILKLPRLGFFNLHASILPRLRGASPIETAIVNGDKETGVTLMEVVPALDAGNIVELETCKISEKETSPELRKKLANLCVPLLKKGLPLIISGKANSTPQDNATATYCRLIDKTDGYLDFSLTTQSLLNHIRGFTPWPGAMFELEGIVYKIGNAEKGDDPAVELSPGKICINKPQLKIGTADGYLKISEIQKPGGKMLPTIQFLNGCQLKSGAKIEIKERYPLVKTKYFKKPKTMA